MKTIFVIIAPSRSGKDTLAKALLPKLKKSKHAVSFKWSDYVKRVVEETYGLNKGDLEIEEIRNSIVPGTVTTYLQILVDFYLTQDRIGDPYFWKRPIVDRLKFLMVQGLDIISTDTRDYFEAETIMSLAETHGYKIVPVSLSREGHFGLASDRNTDQLFKLLASVAGESYSYGIPDGNGYKEALEEIASELAARVG